MITNRPPITIALGALLLTTFTACGDDSGTGTTAVEPPATSDDSSETTDDSSVTTGEPAPEPVTITLVTYESFPTDPENPAVMALDTFSAETGIDVEILIAGDTGTMLSKATLTAGNPEGDVMWGVDNTFLSRAVDADIFEPYEATGLADLPAAFTQLVPDHVATPVDFGDVCVNYDIAALDAAGVAPPQSFDDLASPEYAGLLVVDGWSEAYYEAFSWAGGDRPLVVSYGSSPPFEVLYAAEPLDSSPTGVVEATCVRQVEFAGVLRGTEHPEAAGRLVDFLISPDFQREVALNLFVFPVNPTVELDQVFVDHAAIPAAPLSLDPATIDAQREPWIDAWADLDVN